MSFLRSKGFKQMLEHTLLPEGGGIGDVLPHRRNGVLYDVRKTFKFDAQMTINACDHLNGIFTIGSLFKVDEPVDEGILRHFVGLHAEMVVRHYFQVNMYVSIFMYMYVYMHIRIYIYLCICKIGNVFCS